MKSSHQTIHQKYHIAMVPPLLFAGTSCAGLIDPQDGKELWEGKAKVDYVCTEYATYSGAYYYGYCETYEEMVVELPIRNRYGYFGLYQYTSFSNFLLEISNNYVVFSYVYQYSYASLFYSDNYKYTSGFSYMFPYMKDRNTYRINFPYSDEDTTCQLNETILSCSSIMGNPPVAFQKSRKANLESYLRSL